MSRDRDTDTNANLEQSVIDGCKGKDQNKAFNTPVHITVHSVRNRLADPDGISAKAAIDGLVKAGLLEDDSAKEVKSVTFTQEKCRDEKTIITIREAGLKPR